jgi:hypothetical protein
MSLFMTDEACSAEEAEQALASRGLGDGLPVVPPTQARVDAMLRDVQDPDRVWGQVPPGMGNLTTRAVAYFSTIAGCRPAELPAVVGAARACLSPEMNLLGAQTTTGTAATGLIIHAQLAEAIGANSGAGCLGPGNRVNACVGRALALTLRGVGSARPGITDMATTGQPAKYTLCLAEAPDGPLPGLATRREITGRAVTVFSVSGMSEVIPAGRGVTAEEILEPVIEATVGATCAKAGLDTVKPEEQLFVLPPDLAGQLARLGYGLPEIQQYIFGNGSAALSRQVSRWRPGRLGDGETGTLARSAEDIHPVVAGGAGIKIMYLPLWGNTRSVTCAVPGAL